MTKKVVEVYVTTLMEYYKKHWFIIAICFIIGILSNIASFYIQKEYKMLLDKEEANIDKYIKEIKLDE